MSDSLIHGVRTEIGILVFLAVLAPGPLRAAQSAEPPPAESLEFRETTPAMSNAVLFNPGMGLYLAGGSGLGYQPPAAAWALSLCDIVYFRPSWNDLEAEGPGAGFDAYFDPIFDFWVRQRGKRVAFRVMSESMHSRWKYTTPKWIFHRDVPSVVHQGLRVDQQVDPVFWDRRYLELHCRFIDRLGKYLDGKDGLEYVDIGGIGEWGEMHLGLHIQGRWTTEQLEETGFTREKYVAAYRQVIDAHRRAFPNTRVFLNVGGYPEINDYAALRGCHFRQDGLTPNGPSSNVGKAFYHSYSRRGVICNYEFHSGYRSMIEKGWDLPTTVAQGLSDPISYLNTNILSPQAWESGIHVGSAWRPRGCRSRQRPPAWERISSKLCCAESPNDSPCVDLTWCGSRRDPPTTATRIGCSPAALGYFEHEPTPSGEGKRVHVVCPRRIECWCVSSECFATAGCDPWLHSPGTVREG